MIQTMWMCYMKNDMIYNKRAAVTFFERNAPNDFSILGIFPFYSL